MGKPRRGYISSSCPILLETCRPFPSITAAKNRSLRVTIAFSTCAGARESLLFCFPKTQKPFLLSDGKRGRSRNQGGTPTLPVPSQAYAEERGVPRGRLDVDFWTATAKRT